MRVCASLKIAADLRVKGRFRNHLIPPKVASGPNSNPMGYRVHRSLLPHDRCPLPNLGSQESANRT